MQISQTWTRRIIFGPHRERFRWSHADQRRTMCFNLKRRWSWESTPNGSTTISKVAAQNRMQVIPRVMMNQVPNYHVICKWLSADIADCSRFRFHACKTRTFCRHVGYDCAKRWNGSSLVPIPFATNLARQHQSLISINIINKNLLINIDWLSQSIKIDYHSPMRLSRSP